MEGFQTVWADYRGGISSVMEDVEQWFHDLRIAKRSTQKTEDSTYLLDIDCIKSPTDQNSQLVAVLCSNHRIRVYNKQTLALLQQFQGHSAPISGIRFATTNSHLLFSASCDGTLKCWDVRLSSTEAVQIYKGYPNNAFTSFDISCNDVVICAGTEKIEEDTYMVFWDARSGTNTDSTGGQEPLGVYSETHNNDITQIRFHPSNPNMVASGSTDGLVNVFDISQETEDDALLATCNSDSSVSFVGWSGSQWEQIFCLTHDEGFFLWDLDHLHNDEPITLVKMQDARESLKLDSGHLDYLIGGLYHKEADSLFVLGGSHKGKLHFLKCEAGALAHMNSLHDGHSATVRAFYWDVEDNSLLTCGEDSQLVLWKPNAIETTTEKKIAMKLPSDVHRKMRVHSKITYKSKK
ncbi:WD repeat-containing protein 89 isoform X1 [Mobula hypostoma]|uniref:WD repeat-containing protein 89 isoform X1 n=2 Tax=Mobula hypostoma TaxID=723540 RepID=UPI002FC3B5F3